MTDEITNEKSNHAGTRLRRPPGIWVLLLLLIVLGAAALLTVLLLVGDDTDMEQQPEPQSLPGFHVVHHLR